MINSNNHTWRCPARDDTFNKCAVQDCQGNYLSEGVTTRTPNTRIIIPRDAAFCP